jgi:hypothetical protein
MRKKINQIKIIILFLVSFSFAGLYSDILFLKNGQVLYGVIGKETDTELTFKEKKAKKAKKYPRAQIVRILYKDGPLKKQFIYKKSGASVEAFIVDEDAGRIIIRRVLQKIEEETIPRNEIASISAKKIKKDLPFTFTFPGGNVRNNITIEGDFTGWESEEMVKSGSNWEKRVEVNILKKSDYEYRYIVDGKPSKKKFIKFKVKNGKLYEDKDLLRPRIGLRIGAGFYTAGQSEQFSAEQPAMGGIASINLPFLPEFGFMAMFQNFTHKMNRIKGTVFQSKNIEGRTTNNVFSGFLFYELPLFESLAILPKIGGGSNFQSRSVTGTVQHKESNYVPLVSFGLDFLYSINRFIDLALSTEAHMYLEENNSTWLNFWSLGFNYKL